MQWDNTRIISWLLRRLVWWSTGPQSKVSKNSLLILSIPIIMHSLILWHIFALLHRKRLSSHQGQRHRWLQVGASTTALVPQLNQMDTMEQVEYFMQKYPLHFHSNSDPSWGGDDFNKQHFIITQSFFKTVTWLHEEALWCGLLTSF